MYRCTEITNGDDKKYRQEIRGDDDPLRSATAGQCVLSRFIAFYRLLSPFIAFYPRINSRKRERERERERENYQNIVSLVETTGKAKSDSLATYFITSRNVRIARSMFHAETTGVFQRFDYL